MDFPMPQLERSVAIEPPLERRETIRPHRKASITELEQMVKEFKKERNYSSAEHVMDQIDGLKPNRSTSLALEGNSQEELPYMFRPILDHIEHELHYIRTHGIEQFISEYKDLSCLRDKRYLNAQLSFLEKNE